MIPDRGTLAETAPLKLLLAMDEQIQTGILYFKRNETLKVFYLNQGKISWAISSDEEDKIEHILLLKKLISPEALTPYQAGNRIGESFGKILVENGLISLETLINASRDQLRRIATSVLFWNSGSYQLETESPPTRLVSLELEIAPLVYDYILAHMDTNIIWEELGALSGELQQASRQEKIFQYILDAEQQEVFDCFREPQRPETVLLRFSAERKHTILKILYFLLITGLLIKKEAAPMPSIDFNELDSLFGHDPSGTETTTAAETPAMINEADIKDIPLLDLPDIPDSQTLAARALPEPSGLTPPVATPTEDKAERVPAFAMIDKSPARFQPLLRPEKQKSRWRSVSFLSIALTAVIIGLFLWFTGKTEKKAAEPGAERPAAKAMRKSPERLTNTAAQQESDSLATKQSPVATAVLPPLTDGSGDSQAAAQKAGPENASAGPKPQALPTAVKPPAAKKEEIPRSSQPDSPAQARQTFAADDFETAGKLWRQEILNAEITYSILLEMDCMKQSVQSAFQQIIDKENFFILNRYKDGRSCWLVLWGKFRTQNEATQNLKLIPEYFMKQSNPPVVIELEPYL